VPPPHAHDVLIIGGGAAGLATAIFLRRQSPRPVTVVDGARTLGAKILVSGGGRCNVTNSVVTERDFWGGRQTIIRRVLRALPVGATTDFFRELGVPLHVENDGKLFPDSNRARDVLNALLREADRVGVRIMTGARALEVAGDSSAEARFAVATSRGDMTANALLLATGGRSLPKSGSDGSGYEIARRLGHSLIDTTPALVPLLLADGGWHAGIAGVAHEAGLTLWQDGRAAWRGVGALLWTHFGISGPVALNASRHWERARSGASTSPGANGVRVQLTVSFCPERSFDEIDEQLIGAAQARPRASPPSILADWLPASVAEAIVDRLGIVEAPLSQLPREERRRLAHALAASPLEVTGTRGYTYAEVTAGGVPLDEVDPATLQSRVCPGLYLVGEILDVDGRLGGFNFQWAWSSAFVAARALAGGRARIGRATAQPPSGADQR
jgi:predicted Rossmann fold flavoprotein